MDRSKGSLSKITYWCFSFFILSILIFYLIYTDSYIFPIYYKRFSVFWRIDNSSVTNVSYSTAKWIDQWNFINQDIYIYSAFWEHRENPPFVRIIGICRNKRNNISHLKCLLRYNDGSVEISQVTNSIITENHDQRHTATFYFCQARVMPIEITVVVSGSDREPVWLKVYSTKPLENVVKEKAAVCVRPLYDKFPNNSLLVSEFIAFYQLVGMNHFVFYDYDADIHLRELLLESKKNNVSLDLLSWNLPNEVNDTWMLGQMAAINDCLYRCSRHYEYVLIVDVDEFIVPSQNVTLQQVISDSHREQGTKYVNYMFRNAFFCMEYPDDEDAANISIPLITQRKTRRENKIWPVYQRTKCMVRPIAVTVAGIHFTWKKSGSWKQNIVIDPTVAMIHHYRSNLCKKTDVGSSVVELGAKKYRNLLLQSKPIQIWRELNMRR